MKTTETLQLPGAERDQGGDEEEEEIFLSWLKVLPPLVQTGVGNATTSWGKDGQPTRNLGYYCCCSFIVISAKNSEEEAKPNTFSNFESIFDKLKVGWRDC